MLQLKRLRGKKLKTSDKVILFPTRVLKLTHFGIEREHKVRIVGVRIGSNRLTMLL